MLHQAAQFLLLHRSIAATLRHVAGHILQQIVNERADFGGIKACCTALLRLQTVLHKVSEMAALQLIHTGCRHTDALTVQYAHRLGRQFSASNILRAVHRIQHIVIFTRCRKLLPQLTVNILTCQCQRRLRYLQAEASVLLLHLDGGKQLFDAVDHKRGIQLAAVQIRNRPADPQLLCRLGDAGINVLQFLIQRVKGSVREQNIPLLQGNTLFLIQNATACVDGRQHVIVSAQQKEVLHTVSVIAGDLADLHLIQRSGDRADAVLGQHKAQKPREFLAVQFTVTEDLHKLIQHITQNLP